MRFFGREIPNPFENIRSTFSDTIPPKPTYPDPSTLHIYQPVITALPSGNDFYTSGCSCGYLAPVGYEDQAGWAMRDWEAHVKCLPDDWEPDNVLKREWKKDQKEFERKFEEIKQKYLK